MATIREVRQRAEGVSKIRKITQAMQIVAATRLKRAEKQVLEFRPYALSMKNMFSSIASRAREKHPFLQEKDIKANKTCIVAITSDKGLCGIFNDNIIRHIGNMQKKDNLDIISIGKKGSYYFRRKNLNIIFEYTDIKYDTLTDTCQDLTEKIINLYAKEKFKKVNLLFNRFRLNILGKVEFLQLLPATIEDIESKRDYLYEPNAYKILDELVPAYIESQIQAGLLESKASEEMSRMVAMKYATDNANELINSLNLDYHKARQAQITKEIIEVAGAARE